MFSSFNIKTKLTTVISIMIVVILFLGLFSLNKMNRINNMSTEIAENWMPSIKLIEKINNLPFLYIFNII